MLGVSRFPQQALPQLINTPSLSCFSLLPPPLLLRPPVVVPGYFFTVATIETLGRKFIQYMVSQPAAVCGCVTVREWESVPHVCCLCPMWGS